MSACTIRLPPADSDVAIPCGPTEQDVRGLFPVLIGGLRLIAGNIPILSDIPVPRDLRAITIVPRKEHSAMIPCSGGSTVLAPRSLLVQKVGSGPSMDAEANT